jgi:hypothetical protein
MKLWAMGQLPALQRKVVFGVAILMEFSERLVMFLPF